MNIAKVTNTVAFKSTPWIARRVLITFAAIIVSTLCASAQNTQAPDGESGQITGTVVDVRGDAIAGAKVILSDPSPTDQRTIITGQNGVFGFDNVKPGAPYQVVIKANGFSEWTSPEITLAPGQNILLGNTPLRLATQDTTITVTYDQVDVATEQIATEEKQRILGIIPNFYVSYDGDNAEPLTPEMKFKLALKVSYDPVTIGGVAFIAGIKQANHSPNYQEGGTGYGERLGATAADGFTDIMIGGAILPSLLHEDPRYFYRGSGTTTSRIRHAVLSPFIAKRDNGEWGPNYASLGGDLASSAIANIYYPKSNRGAGLVFGNFAIGTAERVGASLAQELLLGKLTHRGGHIE